MKYFRLLSLLAGMALAGFTSLVGQPVLRQSLTTNTAAAGQVNGDVPTWNAGLGRWDPQAPPGAGGGEANTIVNDGNGVGLYASKVGVALHLNTLTNVDGYIGVASNASLITFTFLQKDLYQHTNSNLTLWQAIAPNAKQDASANLTLLSGYAPDAWQKTNANLTRVAGSVATSGHLIVADANGYTNKAVGSASGVQAYSANLTLLSGYAPDAWQKTNTVLTALTALTDPNANRILMWDDTDNAFVNAVIGANLTYTHASHTLSSTGGAGTGDFMADGSVPMTGTLDMGGNDITNVGTMTMQSLYFLDGTVTNNMTASNVLANIAFIGTNVTAASGQPGLALNVGSTNAIYISGTNSVVLFNRTPSLMDGDYIVTDTAAARFANKTNAVIVTSLQIPNGTGPTTDAAGEIAFDTDAWAASRGAVQVWDGTANTYLVGVLAADAPADNQIPKYHSATGTVTWEADETSAGGESSGTVHSGGTLTTDNRIVRVNGTTGTNIQSSAVTIDDSGNLEGVSGGNFSGGLIVSSVISNSVLTAGQVVFASANKELTGDADMTFSTDTLTVTKIVSQTVTAASNIVYTAGTAATGYVDLDVGVVEETISGAVTLAHATNGAASTLKTAVKIYRNPSGSDQTLTIPSSWNTNAFSAVPSKITNGWTTVLTLTSYGATASSATQTNCYVSFQYYKH